MSVVNLIKIKLQYNLGFGSLKLQLNLVKWQLCKAAFIRREKLVGELNSSLHASPSGYSKRENFEGIEPARLTRVHCITIGSPYKVWMVTPQKWEKGTRQRCNTSNNQFTLWLILLSKTSMFAVDLCKKGLIYLRLKLPFTERINYHWSYYQIS